MWWLWVAAVVVVVAWAEAKARLPPEAAAAMMATPTLTTRESGLFRASVINDDVDDDALAQPRCRGAMTGLVCREREDEVIREL